MSLLARLGRNNLFRATRLGGVRSMGHDHTIIVSTTQDAPKVPNTGGYDAEYFHSEEAKEVTSKKWEQITFAFSAVVVGLSLYLYFNGEHEHEGDIEYEYLNVTRKVPRYPWGDRELFGTPSARAKWREEDAAASE